MSKLVQCPACGQVIYADAASCPHCGHGSGAPDPAKHRAREPASRPSGGAAPRPEPTADTPPPPPPPRPTRAAPAATPAAVPAEIRGWNWGAFFLHLIWGLAHRVWIALLIFVPIVNIAVPFILGAMGNTLAWRARQWESVEQFKRVQRRWAKAGLVLFVVAALLVPAGLFVGLIALFKDSDAYHKAIEVVAASADAREYLGTPIETGFWVTGSVQADTDSGHADLEIPVSGPNGSGTVYLVADRSGALWHIRVLTLEIDDTGRRIDLLMPGGTEAR